MSDDHTSKLDLILLRVGETTGKVAGMSDDLSQIKSRMSKVILRPECTAKHQIVEQHISKTLAEVKEELRRGIQDIKKSTTGQNFAAITPAMFTANQNLTPDEMEAILKEREEERIAKRRKAITWYLGVAITLLTLLGAVGTGLWKMFGTMQNINAVVNAQNTEIKGISNLAKENKSKIIYVKVPVSDEEVDVTPRRKQPPRKRTPN
jgi:hypothetical protein